MKPDGVRTGPFASKLTTLVAIIAQSPAGCPRLISIQFLLLADAVELMASTHNTTARAARISDLFMTYLIVKSG